MVQKKAGDFEWYDIWKWPALFWCLLGWL